MTSPAHAGSPASAASESADPAVFWEARYADSDRVWSGRVNAVLADTIATLAPGSAVDLGCGEGGDVVGLARAGWRALGVDLSPTAAARGREAAAAAGLADAVRFVAADLASWTTDERFDLVTASFLQSWPAEIPRDDILRRATALVAPGGHLLVVAHAEPPSWSAAASEAHHHGYAFPTADGDLAALALPDDGTWEVLACENRSREAIGPDGEPATLVDTVVLVRRLQAD